ncbi:hypothetical protein EMCRGX_G005076 [Ephydatia muelleri]
MPISEEAGGSNPARGGKAFVGNRKGRFRSETTYEMQTLYGLKAVDNPMLSIGFNPFMLVFRIAYCNYFSPHLYHEWKSICENFVINVKHTMPELLNKPKVHLILHLVDCMVNLGPCSAFSAERCESFNATVRAQNIFSNRLAPSRDICNHFAVQQHLRYTCACDGDDNIHAFQNPHMYHVVLNTIGLSCATIEDLHRHDSSTTIELFHCMEDSLVAVFKGVIVADGGLVHAGDFVELLCSETKYALFLTFCQLETGESFCVLQGCDEFVVNSEPVLNEYECPLLAITKRIFSADCSQIKQAVSIVHECSDSCTFDWGSSSRRIEREASGEKALVNTHDWTNMLCCLNVYCV